MGDANPPHSTLPYPPLHADKEFVVLSDWLVVGSSLTPSETISLVSAIPQDVLWLISLSGMELLQTVIRMIVRFYLFECRYILIRVPFRHDG